MTNNNYGPTLEISKALHSSKYAGEGESFEDIIHRIVGCRGIADSEEHRRQSKEILLNMRCLLGGRIQAAVGSPMLLTPFNCFAAPELHDSLGSILSVLANAMETMKRGGGVGYDFSPLRPKNASISTVNGVSSGPVSFMEPYDSFCRTLTGGGGRRGAQMGLLRVDHPDIEEFIRCKENPDRLTAFNISVGITDEFMRAVDAGEDFSLKFKNKIYRKVDARNLYDLILRVNWDWGEPGFFFLDTVNRENNLGYCETITVSNPCGEIPLSPSGTCLLGSLNLVKYIKVEWSKTGGVDYTYSEAMVRDFNWTQFERDIPPIIRLLDNVIDVAIFPHQAQKDQAMQKRRMGAGVTGLANAAEILGYPYASESFLQFEGDVLSTLRNSAYRTSIELAAEKGAFPAFEREYMERPFIQRLPDELQEGIAKHGIRNSHLLSIAPCGTISLTADNISSGLEPPYALEVIRGDMENGVLQDYAYRNFGISGRCSSDISGSEHLAVLLAAQPYVDNAISKTCNVREDIEWEEFQSLPMRAWKGGAKGLTLFRKNCKRVGIMKEVASSCEIMPDGSKSCE